MKNLLCCLFVVLPIVTSAEDQLSESDLDGLSIYADEDFISHCDWDIPANSKSSCRSICYYS